MPEDFWGQFQPTGGFYERGGITGNYQNAEGQWVTPGGASISIERSAPIAGAAQSPEALFAQVTAGLDPNDPNRAQIIADRYRELGVPAQYMKGRGENDLIYIPGVGAVDVVRNQAFLQGRAGPESQAFQFHPEPGIGDPRYGPAMGAGGTSPGGWPGAPPGYSLTPQTGGGPYTLASFGAPGVNAPFTDAMRVPTGTDDPGFQFALQEGQKAIERSAAAKGTLLTGGTLKDLAGYTTGMALQGYGDAWNRARQQYLDSYNIFRGNQANTVGNLGQMSAYGANAAANVGNLNAAQGNAQAAGTVGAGNVNAGTIGNIANTAADALLWSRLFPGAAQRAAPAAMPAGAAAPSLASIVPVQSGVPAYLT